MIFHVVSAGETLYSIGRQYGVSAGLIARVNGLRPPYALAVGQCLLILIPSRTVTVQPGDTLSAIARRTGVSTLELLRRNPNLGGLPQLYPGQVLVVSYEVQPSRQVQVNGYAYPYVQPEVLRGILPYTTYLTPFTYGISDSGSVLALEDAALIAMARQYGVSPLMHLSTLTESGNFSTDRATEALASEASQQQLADQAVAMMQARGYDGMDVDFEFLGQENAAAYAAFVGRLRSRVNALGGELITALAPKTSTTQQGILYEGHDYALLAQNSDAVLLMTYEWGYTYGPPMAVAPLNSVRRVLDYAITEMPPDKIFLGFPNYAYDWTLPFEPGVSRAQSMSNEQAVELAVARGAQIRFDETAQTPWFTYTEAGNVHEVWFEDTRSCQAKYRLIEEYGLRGVGFWNFMRPFSVGFCLLDAMFSIVNLGGGPIAS